MSKEETMTQVRLGATIGGERIDTWIPTKHAHVGIRMTVEDHEGIFEVKQVFDTLPAEIVKKQQEYHRTHRKGTDI